MGAVSVNWLRLKKQGNGLKWAKEKIVLVDGDGLTIVKNRIFLICHQKKNICMLIVVVNIVQWLSILDLKKRNFYGIIKGLGGAVICNSDQRISLFRCMLEIKTI